MADARDKTEKTMRFESMMAEIINHIDYGKRNPVDIGLDCGYSEEELLEMVQWIQEKKGRKTVNDKEGTENVKRDLSEITLAGILQIASGEKKVISDSIVHISTIIDCSGTLEFHNCVIYYNGAGSTGRIILEQESELVLEQCKIICKGCDDENVFISGESKRIVFEKCRFENCSYFLAVYPVKKEILIHNCRMLNCVAGLVSISLDVYNHATATVSNCVIVENMVAEFNLPVIKNALFSLGGEFGEFSECIFVENNLIFVQEKYQGKCNGLHELHIFESLTYEVKSVFKSCTFLNVSGWCMLGKNIIVENCNFKSCKGVIDADFGNIEINNSYFENCTEVIKDAGDNSKISKCMFLECFDQIIISCLWGRITIELCDFVNTKNLIEKEKCYYPSSKCIELRRCKGSDGGINKIEKCCFDGVELNDSFLIAAEGYEKPSGSVADVKECTFMNCTTKRDSGKIIKQFIQYDTLFKKDVDFKAIRIYDCRGLDKINREGSTANPEHVADIREKGKKTGSSIRPEDIENCLWA